MVDSRVSESLRVRSQAGEYEVAFEPGSRRGIHEVAPMNTAVIIDATVAQLYASDLELLLRSRMALEIHASEHSKNLDQIAPYIERLMALGIRRGYTIVAIGGGVVQDIACFLAAILLRGLDWWFYPTTLLAQADSCIGSKSSINVGSLKNIVGTFTPPKRICIDPEFLQTLAGNDVRSGYGEMLKVHAIAGPDEFQRIAKDYRDLGVEAVRQGYIRRSLEIKQQFIEIDEFDRGPRNVLNYGHTFGHALESATHFAIPHGIAVTIGMDMANSVAADLGHSPIAHFERMHPTLRANYEGFEQEPVELEAFMSSIAKDKKHRSGKLTVLLLDQMARIVSVETPNDQRFRTACETYLNNRRAQ